MGDHTTASGPDLATEGLPAEVLSDEIPAVAQFEGKPVIVVRVGDEVRAVGGSCSHYGGPLGDGLCYDGKVQCPWHHAIFDLVTGEAVGAPALNPVPVYETTEREGRVFVTGRRKTRPVSPPPPSPPSSAVIVGAGAAGATAAETLRRLGFQGPVTLIGDEAPIDRPNVSKDYLAGTAPEEWMPLRAPSYYEDHRIDLILGRQVSRLVPDEQVVELDDGSRLGYGALLLAPGAEPKRLPVPGSDQAHVHYLRTLEDSRSIISALDGSAQAVVIGAGFIGLEAAASLRQRDVAVTVVAPEDVPLTIAVGDTLGRFVQDLHEEHGVRFRLGRTIAEIHGDSVALDDGSIEPADLVVIGIGVSPRTDLAEQAGLAVDDGVVVDDHLQTSDSHIWAAGDAARYPDPRSGSIRVEHWVLAQRQGQVAARNMLGYNVAFNEPPFFWSQHYDVPINVTGHGVGWEQEMVSGDPARRDVLVGLRKDGAIRAVLSIYRDLDCLHAERALDRDDQTSLERMLGG